jgi:hypothetical protein
VVKSGRLEYRVLISSEWLRVVRGERKLSQLSRRMARTMLSLSCPLPCFVSIARAKGSWKFTCGLEKVEAYSIKGAD